MIRSLAKIADKLADKKGRPGGEPVATAHDVAAYILAKTGPISAMKLQKLLYYAQSWHLVWDEQPLFGERIEAWANGPVLPDIYNGHRGQFLVTDWPAGDPNQLNASERESVDIVLGSYGELDGRRLSHLTHAEAPWANARVGLHPTERSHNVITTEAMAEYYGSLDTAEEAVPIDDLPWEGWDTGASATV